MLKFYFLTKLKFSLVVLLFLSSFSFAGDLVFRGGRIIIAQLTEKAQSIPALNSNVYTDIPENKVYAMVTMQLHAGKNISIYDYSLQVYGKNYPCVAIKVDNGHWMAGDNWKISPTDPKKCYSLLFILDGKVVGLNKVENLKLYCNALPKNVASVALDFENLGKTKDFSTPTSAISKGLLIEKEK
jgi:hypothetical protein